MRTHSRRALLGAGIAVAGNGLLTACATGASGSGRQAGPDGKNVMDHSHDSGDVPPGYVSPDGPEVAETERRRGAGPVRHYSLTAAETRLDLGGRTVRTWAYGDELPGKELRITAGDRMALTLANHLPQSTTLHWHGLAVRNDMDGVPGLTQRSVKPGAPSTTTSRSPTPVRTGCTRTTACSWTAGSTRRSSSRTPGSRSRTTRSGSS